MLRAGREPLGIVGIVVSRGQRGVRQVSCQDGGFAALVTAIVCFRNSFAPASLCLVPNLLGPERPCCRSPWQPWDFPSVGPPWHPSSQWCLVTVWGHRTSHLRIGRTIPALEQRREKEQGSRPAQGRPLVSSVAADAFRRGRGGAKGSAVSPGVGSGD